jgi:hypothetical protein
MENSRVAFLWQDSDCVRRFSTAVCLHGHTMHSEECLCALPRAHTFRSFAAVGGCQQRDSVVSARALDAPLSQAGATP